jgi:hypothetical protein
VDLHRELLPARRSFWKNKPTWTIGQFVYLLHDYDPVKFGSPLGIVPPKAMMLKKELSDWLEWSADCPSILPSDRYPMEAPVDKNELISWATGLSEVQIPEWMLKLIEKQKHSINKNNPAQLGERGQENLSATIGALALVVANTTGPHHGTPENPNVKNISASCIEIIGKVYGLGESALRDRISKGIQALYDKER